MQQNALKTTLFALIALSVVVILLILVARRQRAPIVEVPTRTPVTETRSAPPTPASTPTPAPTPEPVATATPAVVSEPELEIQESAASLCAHRFLLSLPPGATYDGIQFHLEIDDIRLATDEELTASMERLLGAAATAPNNAALSAAILDAWPPVIGPDGSFQVLLGDNAKVRLVARAEPSLLGSALLFRCEDGVRDLALKETFLLVGAVIERDTNMPLPGIGIRIQGVSGLRTATSDIEGRFSFPDLPRDQYFLIPDESTMAGYLPEKSPIFLGEDAGTEPVLVVLAKAGNITVTVTNEAGAPVPDAQVTLLPTSAADAAPELAMIQAAFAVTNEAGIATLSTTFTGSVNLRVNHREYDQHEESIDLADGGSYAVTLRGRKTVTFRFVTEDGALYEEPLTVMLPKLRVLDFPGRDVRARPSDREFRVVVHGELAATLRDSSTELEINAIGAEGAASASYIIPGDILLAAASSGNPIDILVETDHEELVLVVHDAAGQVPESYRVEVAIRGGRPEQFKAEDLRAGYDPQAAFETLVLPVAPVFPLNIKVVGVNNFIGEASFNEPAEYYEIRASRSRFAIITLDEPGYGPNAALGRRTEPRLSANPPGISVTMGSGVFKGYLPLGQVVLRVEWLDIATQEQRFVTREIYIEDRKEPFELTITGAPEPTATEAAP